MTWKSVLVALYVCMYVFCSPYICGCDIVVVI